jgi:uncharacterized protein (TIGR00369 family)
LGFYARICLIRYLTPFPLHGPYTGISLEKLNKDEVIAVMPITENHTQPMGLLHGGVSVLLAETVASVGSYLSVGPESVILGLEINANHVSPGYVGDTAIARGVPLIIGRRNQVWEIIIRSKASGKIICISRCTISVVPRAEMDAKKSSGEKRATETISAKL